MRKEIYDKSYASESLTIPATIWNDDNVKGIAKMMLALYKKLTKDGTEPIKNMTIRQAQICATRKKDIEYNQNKLVALGAIKISSDVVMGEILEYTYKLNEKPIEDTSSKLF